MKLLIVTNLYPPYYRGGYEVRCKQVAEALDRVGHDVRVLTSTYGLTPGAFRTIEPLVENVDGVRVHRALNQYLFEPQPPYRPWTVFHAKRQLWDARHFISLLEEFKPDIVNWWGMYGLSKTLLPIPVMRSIPDVHWIEHWWMIEEYGSDGERASCFWVDFWNGNWGPRRLRPFFRMLARSWENRFRREGIPTRTLPNRPRHVCFVSEYMRTLHRNAGLVFPSSEIIYGGVPTERFYEPIKNRSKKSDTLRILYAGQISPDRGLHTVINALGRMAPSVQSQVSLTVVGEGPADYVAQIGARCEELHLTARVDFRGKLQHDQMADVYKQHEILVFPSIRAEGLPLTMVEAMLAGCAVVTTGSGGAMEVAAPAALPLFPKNDAVTLSKILMRLVADPRQVTAIAARGQEVALQEFTFDRMMDRFQSMLRQLHDTTADLNLHDRDGGPHDAAVARI